MSRGAFVVALVAAAFVLAACGGSDEPSVSFVQPKEGERLTSPMVARVEIEHFEIDPSAIDHPKESGHGQVRFEMDGGKYDVSRYATNAADLARQAGGPGRYSLTLTPSISYRNLPPGRHTLTVKLVNNDGTETGAKDSVTFNITQ